MPTAQATNLQPTTLADRRTPLADTLHTYIDTRYDLHRTSHLTRIPIPDLLTWLADPETTRTLDRLRAALEQALALRCLEAKQSALGALEHVINNTDDLIEKRRAATALLRALTTRPRPESDPSRVRMHASAPSAQCQVPSASPSAASHQDSGLKTQDSLPSLLTRLAHALTRDDPDAQTADNALAALHAACAEGATLNDQPIPADVDDFIQHDDLQHIAPIARVDVAPPTLADRAAAARLTCTHHDDTQTDIAIALVLEDHWQIVAILVEPHDTS
jgi:hypothetical protein